MKRLLETKEDYVCGSEEEAKIVMEEFREEAPLKGYLIKSSGYKMKEKRSKGDVIGTAYVVTIVKVFSELWEDLMID